MKRRNLVLLSSALLATVFLGFVPPSGDNSIALAVKVIRDVSRKGEKIDWTSAKKGDELYSGDQVRTADRSIAIVKFKDGSMLRVRESSELKLFGKTDNGIFSKTVNVSKGEFSFDIQKQSGNEKFTFSSPTSVAAIRGTEGTFSSSATGDQLVVLEGLVNFLNTLSNKDVNVGAGQTAVSNSDGTIYVRQSTPTESSDAQSELDAANGTGKAKQLDIEVKDKDGNKKKVRINYHG